MPLCMMRTIHTIEYNEFATYSLSRHVLDQVTPNFTNCHAPYKRGVILKRYKTFVNFRGGHVLYK